MLIEWTPRFVVSIESVKQQTPGKMIAAGVATWRAEMDLGRDTVWTGYGLSIPDALENLAKNFRMEAVEQMTQRLEAFMDG